MEFFLELLLNSANLINQRSMKLAQFKDLVSHMCLTNAVVAFWFLIQEVAGSSPLNNGKYFCH